LSRLALGPTQPANPMGTGGCLLWVKQRGVKLTIHTYVLV
jgi:hypothetical protein